MAGFEAVVHEVDEKVGLKSEISEISVYYRYFLNLLIIMSSLLSRRHTWCCFCGGHVLSL